MDDKKMQLTNLKMLAQAFIEQMKTLLQEAKTEEDYLNINSIIEDGVIHNIPSALMFIDYYDRSHVLYRLGDWDIDEEKATPEQITEIMGEISTIDGDEFNNIVDNMAHEMFGVDVD